MGGAAGIPLQGIYLVLEVELELPPELLPLVPLDPLVPELPELPEPTLDGLALPPLIEEPLLPMPLEPPRLLDPL